MSKLWTFPTYEEYVEKQRRGSRRRPHRQPSADRNESLLISGWCIKHGLSPKFVLCHGARCGTEVQLMRKRFAGSEVIGTDLEPMGNGVVQWDFQKPNPEWDSRADLIYSNSIDHSCFPEETAKLWLSQLSPTGRLFLQWTSNCLKIIEWASLYQGGDCYGANLHEYIRLLERVGIVEDLIYCGINGRGTTKVLVVAKKKGKP